MGERAVNLTEGTAQDDQSPKAGRLKLDDRGNVTWVWADDAELQADNTLGALQRMRALVDPSLDVLDDGTRSMRRIAMKGYDPYNSGTPPRKPAPRSRTLQKLSKWVELRNRILGRP